MVDKVQTAFRSEPSKHNANLECLVSDAGRRAYRPNDREIRDQSWLSQIPTNSYTTFTRDGAGACPCYGDGDEHLDTTFPEARSLTSRRSATTSVTMSAKPRMTIVASTPSYQHVSSEPPRVSSI